MKKLFVLAVISFLAFSCNKDEDPFLLPEGPTSSEDYIVFGNYYGFCAGADCINIYKITNTTLSANTNREYPSNDEFFPGVYEQLAQEKFEAVKTILSATPPSLLKIEDSFIGCPDCADGGGVYFEYKVGDVHKHWLIDQVKGNIPTELHDLVDAVNQAVITIKQ